MPPETSKLDHYFIQIAGGANFLPESGEFLASARREKAGRDQTEMIRAKKFPLSRVMETISVGRNKLNRKVEAPLDVLTWDKRHEINCGFLVKHVYETSSSRKNRDVDGSEILDK